MLLSSSIHQRIHAPATSEGMDCESSLYIVPYETEVVAAFFSAPPYQSEVRPSKTVCERHGVTERLRLRRVIYDFLGEKPAHLRARPKTVQTPTSPNPRPAQKETQHPILRTIPNLNTNGHTCRPTTSESELTLKWLDSRTSDPQMHLRKQQRCAQEPCKATICCAGLGWFACRTRK